MITRILLLSLLLAVQGLSQNSRGHDRKDLDAFAHKLAGDAPTDYGKARNILGWLGTNCSWLSTDYKTRTVEEILDRGGGNCFELAKVFMDLIRRVGIRHRQIAEVNIQPVSEGRQRSAEGRIQASGARMSVFGRQHNDHRWVEIWDERTQSWQPADPSMGVLGTDQWLKARVWFGERMTIDTSITNDMLVPVAIFVVDSSLTYEHSRTEHYLVNAFNGLYGNRLSGLPSWKSWKEQLSEIDPYVRGAFLGTQNLHDQQSRIAALWETYGRLKEEWKGK